jgi:hypothetical protein
VSWGEGLNIHIRRGPGALVVFTHRGHAFLSYVCTCKHRDGGEGVSNTGKI